MSTRQKEKAALRQEYQGLITEADQIAKWRIATTKLLNSFWLYLIQAHRKAYTCIQTIQKGASTTSSVSRLDEKIERFSNWESKAAHPAYQPLHPSLIRAFVWGDQYGRLLWQWWTSLVWPSTPVDDDPGISHFELLVNFQLTTGEYIPMCLQKGSFIRYVSPRHEPQLLSALETEARAIKAFDSSLRQLTSLVGRDAPAIPSRGFVRSMQLLGDRRRPPRGFLQRPVIPKQSETIGKICDFLERLRQNPHLGFENFHDPSSVCFTTVPDAPESEEQARLRFRRYQLWTKNQRTRGV